MKNKNIMINEKSCKYLVICSARDNPKKSIETINLYNHELVGKIEKYDRKK